MQASPPTINVPKMSAFGSSINLSGPWNAHKECCDFGYSGVWEITQNGDKLTIVEQPGAHCCFCVPNCFLKTHNLTRTGERKWEGTLCMKPVWIEKVSETELKHMTTDGLFTLTRS